MEEEEVDPEVVSADLDHLLPDELLLPEDSTGEDNLKLS